MFKKIKEVAGKGKQWAINHKVDLAYFGGAIVGVAATTIAYNYTDTKNKEAYNKKFAPEIRVLSTRKDAYWIDALYPTNNPCTMSELSDRLIANGAEKGAPVIGALVYSKKE